MVRRGAPDLLFTSRTEDLREITETWLRDNGFKFHSVLLGKPRGGNYHWIDNHLVKATRYKGKFTDMIEKKVKIKVLKINMKKILANDGLSGSGIKTN